MMGLKAVLRQQTRPTSIDRTALMSLIEDSMNEPKLPDISAELERLSFAFLAFKDWGPSPLVHHDMNFTTEDPDNVLDRLGVFFMAVLGQGDAYYEGLYGPLPVHGYEDQLAYLFGFSVHDASITDERSEETAYCNLVLFFPRKIANYLQASFKIISQVLSHAFSEITDIQELTESFLEKIKDQLKFAIDYWHLLTL
ncbi:MAG: hypothetical protein ACFFBD_11240 [Candidatus Hodarchaeota archaeon]